MKGWGPATEALYPTGPAAGLAASLVVFGLQVILSNLWLKKHRFGPVEWVWRTATYGAPP